jgi:hypothetical protein
MSDGSIRYTPKRDFYRNTSDVITMVLQAPDGTLMTRCIVVNSFGAISGKFQSLLTVTQGDQVPAPPGELPSEASSEASKMRGLVNVQFSSSAVISGRVRLEGETISFRGPVTGGVSYIKTNRRIGNSRWDISLVYSESHDNWDVQLVKHGDESVTGNALRTLKRAEHLAGKYTSVCGMDQK